MTSTVLKGPLKGAPLQGPLKGAPLQGPLKGGGRGVFIQCRPGTRMKRMKHPTDGSFHPSLILKLQTARFRTLFELQTRDLVQNHRLDVL